MADWKTLARFLAKFERDDQTGCWEWTDALNNRGYGSLRVRPAPSRGAHVVAYELFVGPLPAGLEIDHLCRVRHCVNPEHLEAVTRSENMRRAPLTDALRARRRAGARAAGAATGARNVAKTHCPQGHAYDEANTYTTPTGGRACRECQRTHSREWQRAKRAEGGRTS